MASLSVKELSSNDATEVKQYIPPPAPAAAVLLVTVDPFTVIVVSNAEMAPWKRIVQRV